MDEVDFTILAATSVFTDLIEKCPPAEACRDAFDRTAKATIKMANSTGGFGQLLPGQSQGSKSRPSRGATLDDRLNWSSRNDANRPRHQQRTSMDYSSPGAPQSRYDISDTYSNSSAFSLNALPQHQNKRYRVPNPSGQPSTATTEDGFSTMRSVPQPPHSTTSSTDALSPEAASAIDPSLMPSPSQQTPPIAPRQQQQSFFPPQPRQLQFSNLQGIDFLQTLQGGGTFNANDFNTNNDSSQMDLNFGLGWEGLHHDFSDGQQLDLFDGFFFGDQRGTGGGGGGGGIGNLGSGGMGLEMGGQQQQRQQQQQGGGKIDIDDMLDDTKQESRDL